MQFTFLLYLVMPYSRTSLLRRLTAPSTIGWLLACLLVLNIVVCGISVRVLGKFRERQDAITEYESLSHPRQERNESSKQLTTKKQRQSPSNPVTTLDLIPRTTEERANGITEKEVRIERKEHLRKQPAERRQLDGTRKDAVSQEREIMVHLHIGKCGGTSFDPVASKIAKKTNQNYVGHAHFDWTRIEKIHTTSRLNVVTILRHPVSRAISHFHFAKRLGWTAQHPIFRDERLDEFLKDPQTMLEIRDVWQDGQASVSWLTGTHIGNWVVRGLTERDIVDRETRALDYPRMLNLAADHLESTAWFALLEDMDRSLELLRHTFNLAETPEISHSNPGRKRVKADALSEWAKDALASLMPQDLWLYEYGQRLFEARWTAYKERKPVVLPPRPPLPDHLSCSSTRFHLECVDGVLAGTNHTWVP